MDPVPRRLDINPRAASKLQADLAATLVCAVGEESPQLGQQRRESQAGRRGKLYLPEALGELVAAGDSIAIDRQVSEQEAPLPARQLLLDAPATDAGDELPTELDPCPVSVVLPVGHSAKLAPKRRRDNEPWPT